MEVELPMIRDLGSKLRRFQEKFHHKTMVSTAVVRRPLEKSKAVVYSEA